MTFNFIIYIYNIVTRQLNIYSKYHTDARSVSVSHSCLLVTNINCTWNIVLVTSVYALRSCCLSRMTVPTWQGCCALRSRWSCWATWHQCCTIIHIYVLHICKWDTVTCIRYIKDGTVFLEVTIHAMYKCISTETRHSSRIVWRTGTHICLTHDRNIFCCAEKDFSHISTERNKLLINI